MKFYAAIVLLFITTSTYAGEQSRTYHFAEPIDALSLGVETDTIHLEVSAKIGDTWTEWQQLEIEKEFDPLLQESNLILFPKPTGTVRIRGATSQYEIHPIRVATDPASYAVAARGSMGVPRILSRRQWGADESFAYKGKAVSRSDEPTATTGNGNGSVPERVQECERAQQKYPQEFRTDRTISEDRSGKTYRWPRRYSPNIRQLVVHHTAQKISGDARPPVERMRALYDYHANGRGWGDIGYHYIIDEKGQIYEGRGGGKNVVGGHVYCGNVGSIGIAMMGNFELEKPTQAQTSSLKWLLADLADTYDINLERSTKFHGGAMPVVVGHGDLIATECPGYYVRNTLGTIRKHVIAGNYSAKIPFPSITKRTERQKSTTFVKLSNDLQAIGKTTMTGRPGGLLHISMQYSPRSEMQRRGRIAKITRSNSTIGLWQETGGHYARMRNELIAPSTLRSGDSETLRLRVQLPRIAGIYTVDIGDITYVLTASGRRASGPKTEPTRQSFTPDKRVNTQTPGYRRSRVTGASSRITSSSDTHETIITNGDDNIRIRLSFTEDSATLETTTTPYLNDIALRSTRLELTQQGNNCVLQAGGQVVDSGVIRIDARNGIHTVSNWKKPENRFRGILECRILYGELVLINELPLEDYMAGLAEEPDSQHPEKQKAFAVAARSYAAFYMQNETRKFPGMPYDGSDTGASFQNYAGYFFERNNPKWVRAAEETAGLVLQKRNRIVKAAYFSSSDGRTRSPAENGWKNFPFAEVFKSKPDPWCEGLPLRGHGVGMSGCGASGQVKEGKTAEEILTYYYPGTDISLRK